MQPEQPAAQQQTDPKNDFEVKIRDLDERYLIGLQNLAMASQQSKMNKIQSWNNTDKLVNDLFSFSLITLSVMAAILTAKEDLIGNKALFYLALGLQAFVVIFSSIVRLFIDGHSAKTGTKVFEELSNRINKIDAFRIAMTNTDQAEKGRVRAEMTSSFAPEYEYKPDDTKWILKNGQKTAVSVFIVAFLFFILSIVFNVGVNTK